MSSCCCQYECSCVRLVTTSTTTTTTLCPDAIPCDAAYDLNCVVYTGCNDDCPQITTGDSLVQVFLNLFEMIVVECGEGITTTTTIEPVPEELVAICLGYSPDGGCSGACATICENVYAYTACANYININNAFATLGCILYSDSLGTNPAPSGWYSRPSGLCYVVNTNGSITGIQNCP